ncbi:unnamed protein product [Lactuca virosa]|uniref:Uncharacterized protein n=1 Tax=Lactuca virosa TaxID=75947 RepID=A0AAU9MIE3_9ASTR|nr:unnamed protein product [Lactuca virosa]
MNIRCLWWDTIGARTAVWHLSFSPPDRVKGIVYLSVLLLLFLLLLSLTLFYMEMSFIKFRKLIQESGSREGFCEIRCLTVIKKFLLINHGDVPVAPPGIEIIDHMEIPSAIREPSMSILRTGGRF